MAKKRGMSLIRLPLRCSIEVTKERRDTEGVSREIGSEKSRVERNSRQVCSRECPGGEAHAGGHGLRDAGRLDGNTEAGARLLPYGRRHAVPEAHGRKRHHRQA